MQRSFENGFCLFQFVKIPWCHKREMLLEKRNAILLQDIRHKRRTGIMILLIKRYLKQDERQSDNTVVISLSLFIALQKLSCNTFFLFCRTLHTDYFIFCMRKYCLDLQRIFFFKAGDQRNGRIPSTHTVGLS